MVVETERRSEAPIDKTMAGDNSEGKNEEVKMDVDGSVEGRAEENMSGVPRDVLIIDGILREMGAREYNPKVVAQLLEFSHRYVSEILEDASDYKEHAGKKNIDLEDVRLATQNKDLHSFTSPVPREILLEIARNCNKQPLPAISERFGVRVPDEQYCLTAANYQVLSKPSPGTAEKNSQQ